VLDNDLTYSHNSTILITCMKGGPRVQTSRYIDIDNPFNRNRPGMNEAKEYFPRISMWFALSISGCSRLPRCTREMAIESSSGNSIVRYSVRTGSERHRPISFDRGWIHPGQRPNPSLPLQLMGELPLNVEISFKNNT
jgi:hypothetical protein